MPERPSMKPGLLLAAVLLVLFAIGGYLVDKSQTPTLTPTKLTAKVTATKKAKPIHCPTIPGFAPNLIIEIAGYQAQTVLTKDGCPAVLVLMPMKPGEFINERKDTPAPMTTGVPKH